MNKRIQKLINLIGATKHAAPITIIARTPVKLTKVPKDHFLKNKSIFKIAQVNGFINVNYENAVNRKNNTTDFKAQKTYGQFFEGIPYLLGTPDNTMLRMIVKHSNTLRYIDETGAEIQFDTFKDFMPPKRENHLDVRNYSVNNILKVKFDRQEISL